MKRVRYTGEGVQNGPWGTFASGDVREVSDEHAAYMVASYPWFEVVKDSPAPAADPGTGTATKPAATRKK